MGQNFDETLNTMKIGEGENEKIIPTSAKPDNNGNPITAIEINNIGGDPIFTPALPGNVQISGSLVSDEFTFQNAAISANDGTANKLNLNGKNQVLLSINRTSITANSISFRATGPNGGAGYVFGYKVNSDNTITTGSGSAATTNEVWLITNLAGYTDFYVSINSMTGTSITVKGKAVA